MADESDIVITASYAKWVMQKIQHDTELLERNNKCIKEKMEKMDEAWKKQYSECHELLEISKMIMNEELDLKSLDKMNTELKDRVVELEKILAEKSKMGWYAITAVATIAALVFYLRRI